VKVPELAEIQLGELLVFLNVIFEVDPKLKVAPLLLVIVNEVLVPVVIWHDELLIPALKIPLLVRKDDEVPSLKVITDPPFTVNKAELLLVIPQPVEKAMALPLITTLPGLVLVHEFVFPVKFISDEVTVTEPVFAKTLPLPGKLNVEAESKDILPVLELVTPAPLEFVPILSGEAVALIVPVFVSVPPAFMLNGDVVVKVTDPPVLANVVAPLNVIGDRSAVMVPVFVKVVPFDIVSGETAANAILPGLVLFMVDMALPLHNIAACDAVIVPVLFIGPPFADMVNNVLVRAVKPVRMILPGSAALV